MDGLTSFTYTDTATAGNSTQTVDNARITFPEAKAFGEPAVRGYQISSVYLTFPTGEITVAPKCGDYVAVDGSTYEVTKAEKATAFTRWKVTAERAYIETDWATTTTVQRATLSKDSASAVVKTWAAVYSNQSTVVLDEDDVADMAERLGVRADKKTITFFYPQSLSIEPLDRIVYGSRNYRITQIVDAGRVARLLKARGELYA